MKRLVKKSSEFDMINTQKMNGMTQLNELDEADVRHDRCPVCKNSELIRNDGFKECPKCGSTYKVFNGNAYLIEE